MKANCTEFETKIDLSECGAVFRLAVDKRPVKSGVKFKYFTTTSDEDPFAQMDGSVEPDFDVGAAFELAELYGSVVMPCLSQADGTTLVSLRSTGNMRGRGMTNSLVKHIVSKFQERDGAITVTTGSGRI